MRVAFSPAITIPHISASVVYLEILEKINSFTPTLLFFIPGIVRFLDYES